MPAREVFNMFGKFKYERKIKKAVNKTVKEFENSTPKISQHFFYGAFWIAPQNLVIWYLFKTNDELALAKENGLCDKLISQTTQNLLDEGYPKEAFSKVVAQGIEKITFDNKSNAEIDDIMKILQTGRSVMISFTTEQDIDEKANGDYRMYFQ